MFWGVGIPAGFCDRPAFGQQYRGAFLPVRFSPPNRPPYAPGLCCDHHGGPGTSDLRFIRDGDMWCAFMPGFVNLQESDAGFGATQEAAANDFKARSS